MVKLRKAVAYRSTERPYTRKSKFRKKSFIRATPQNKVVMYDMGNKKQNFNTHAKLISKEQIQVRHNAIESSRLTSNRHLENILGRTMYHLKINIYPHHILRENPLAAGAGADRMSTGMKMSFGKPIGLAAQVKKGQTLLTVNVDKENIEVAKQSLKKAAHKLPCSCIVKVE
jgi:large subunit ribosomal protein L10e